MTELTDITNALADHEQALNQYIGLVEQIITDLRKEVDALKSSIVAGDPGTQIAINSLQQRIAAATATIRESRTRV